MAFRSVLTTGVSMASVATVAATVALASPTLPQDVRAAHLADVELAALITDPVQADVVKQFFNYGVKGIVWNQLLRIAGTDTQAQSLINGYFQDGVTNTVWQYLAKSAGPLTGDYGDPDYNYPAGFLNILFNIQNPGAYPEENGVARGAPRFGITGVILARLSMALSLEQQFVLGDYVHGGLTRVVHEQLKARFTDPAQQEFIDDFFEAGLSEVVRTALKNATTDLEQLKVIDDLFSGGISLVIRNQLMDRTSDPNQKYDIESFFNGGLAEVVRLHLASAAVDDEVATTLINAFFSEGVTKVARELLIGLQPVPNPVPNNVQNLRLVQEVAAPPIADPAPVQADPAQADPPKVDPPKVDPPTSDPVVQQVAAPAPAPDPVPEPDPKPKFTIHVDEEADPGAKVVEENPGNKFEPEILVNDGGSQGNGPGWGIFGQVADAIGRTMAEASAPPAGSPAPGAGDAGGDGEGGDGGEG